MPQPLGTLYLVPAPLDFACDTQSDIADVLPQLTLVRAASLRHWVVENAKSSRAVLKRIGAVTPLVCSLQEMQLQELPRATCGKSQSKAGRSAPSGHRFLCFRAG